MTRSDADTSAVGSWATSEAVRASMLANRRRDTAPELAVRRLLHASGLRYRVDFAPLATDRRRRADIVFTKRRIAVFIDGCFWHGCPEHFTAPRANADYWRAKIARNVERDSETTQALSAEGWLVLRFWEHEQAQEVASAIITAASGRPVARSTSGRATGGRR